MVAEEVNSFNWTNRQQYIVAITANLIVLSHGCIMGWLAPALSTFQSLNTPLSSGPLNSAEISWIGSINCCGALIGTLSFGYIISLIGSKRTVSFLAIPHFVSWLFVYFGNTYYYILISRFIGGWASGGLQTALILYISEIANDEIRGRLGSLALLTRNVGVLIAYILGAYVPYEYIACIYAIIPIVFIVAFTSLPNTPRFYLQKLQIHKAEDALKYYKGYRGCTEKEDRAFYNEFERLKTIDYEQKMDDKFDVSKYFNHAAMKGLGIGVALSICLSFTAIYIITSYAVITFQKAGTTIDPYVSSIAIALALIFGSLTTATLADRLGRKTLNLISLMGSACGLLITALYIYLKCLGYDLSSFSWIPLVALSFVVFITAAGIGALYSICSVEHLPSNIRTGGLAIICFVDNLWTFTCTKFYPILLEKINLHGCLGIYGIGCIIGFIFVLLVLQETSGKSLDDVGSEKTVTKRQHLLDHTSPSAFDKSLLFSSERDESRHFSKEP